MQAYDYVWIGDALEKRFYDKKSQDYHRAKKNYQSDKRIVGSVVPSWFVILYCEKPFRIATKKQLHQWKKNDNCEVMIPHFLRSDSIIGNSWKQLSELHLDRMLVFH